MELHENGVVFPEDYGKDRYLQDWLKPFIFVTGGTEMAVFVALSVIIILAGLISNGYIIISYLAYKCRNHKASDLHSPMYASQIPSVVRWGPTSTLRSTLGTLLKTFEGRSVCFLALATHARLKYIHIIYANAVFNLISCIVFIPLVVLYLCVGDRFFLVMVMPTGLICQAWSLFQVNFLALSLLVNTTILFFSTTFPLHFSLKRTPFTLLICAIILLCFAQVAAAMVFIINRSDQSLLGDVNSIKNADIIRAFQTIPLGIFVATLICTLVLQPLTWNQLSHAASLLYTVHREPALPVWHNILLNIRKDAINLSIASIAYYFMEMPFFLLIYSPISSHRVVLISHFSVHAVNALVHIRLCQSLRNTTMNPPQTPKKPAQSKQKRTMISEGDTTAIV